MPENLEHQLRGIASKEAKPDAPALQRRSDLLEVAKTAAGQRIFHSWLKAERRPVMFGEERTGLLLAYQAGRRGVGEAFEKELKGALPRELFLNIAYPKNEEEP